MSWAFLERTDFFAGGRAGLLGGYGQQGQMARGGQGRWVPEEQNGLDGQNICTHKSWERKR